jgi:hypothetical protein
MAKTWKQKLEDPKEPKVTTLGKAMNGVPAGGRLLMPTPKLVQAFMNGLPKGERASLDEMRVHLAQSRDADLACPLTTATAARTVAEAAWEDLQAGKAPEEVTPFWRVIDPASKVAQKLLRKREGLDVPPTHE